MSIIEASTKDNAVASLLFLQSPLNDYLTPGWISVADGWVVGRLGDGSEKKNSHSFSH